MYDLSLSVTAQIILVFRISFLAFVTFIGLLSYGFCVLCYGYICPDTIEHQGNLLSFVFS